MPNKKLKIGVIFGGKSGEHEVSLVSAESIIKALDKKKYDVLPIGITKEGDWLVENKNLLNNFKSGKIKSGSRLPPKEIFEADVIFPIVHGSFGEDGTLQGLLEMLDLPYVGAGVLGSAVGMDKVIQKQVFEQAGLPVVPYTFFKKIGDEIVYIDPKRPHLLDIETPLKVQNWDYILRHIKFYPLFIKPANSGSSVGISKAHNRDELMQGIKLAIEYDHKILIEQAVLNVREIECAVLGNDEPKASKLGEILPSNEFYDYDAKYVDGKTKTVIPAPLPSKMAKVIQDLACQAFKACEGSGMARVDFLVDNKTKKIFLNEVNTIPGFTSISMYPKMWAASGLSYPKLLDRLIDLALERYQEKQKLHFNYQPKEKWFK